MTNFQKILLGILVLFLVAIVYFWRQDVKYKKCVELGIKYRLGTAYETFRDSECGKMLRKEAGIEK